MLTRCLLCLVIVNVVFGLAAAQAAQPENGVGWRGDGTGNDGLHARTGRQRGAARLR